MNLHSAQRELRKLARAGNAVLLRGPSGLGKSSIALAEFEYLKSSQPNVKWGLGVIFAATQTPPDLIGYQFKGDRDFGDGKKVTVTEPSVPLWMLSCPHTMLTTDAQGNNVVVHDEGGKPAWMYDRFYLIIDEYGQGEGDTKRALAEIFLKGGTAPWYLPPGSIRVGCTNIGSRYGVTKDFDFCIARRCQIDIAGDIEITLKYMDKPYRHNGKEWQVLPITKAWAATHPETVFETEPKEQGPWCMPRTLVDFDRYLQVVMEDNNGTLPLDDNEQMGRITEVGAGLIGMGATTSFVGHMQFELELPKYADIIADPQGTPVPTKADLMMLMAYELAHYTKVEDLAPCIAYIQRLPKDMAVTYISALLRRDYKNIVNQPAMQGWINKNATLVGIIASLAN